MHIWLPGWGLALALLHARSCCALHLISDDHADDHLIGDGHPLMPDDHADPLRRSLQTSAGSQRNATGQVPTLPRRDRGPVADFLWEAYLNVPWVGWQSASDKAALTDASELIGTPDRLADPPPRLGFSGRIAQLCPVLVVLLMGGNKLQTVLSKRLSEGAGVEAMHLVEIACSLLLYLISGPAVILVNKHIMKHYGFHFPIVLASLGNFFLMLVTRGAVLLGVKQVDREKMDWRSFLMVVVPINLCNFATQVTGMYAYLYISVPEIQILKSFTIVFVLIFAWFLAKERVNTLLACAVGVITSGVCVSAMYGSGAGVGKETGHAALIGFWLSMIASSTEALKSVISQIMMNQLSLFDGIYWSSPSFVVLALTFICSIELKGLAKFEWSTPLVLTLLFNALLTGVIVVSTFWFVKLAGALTLKVITQARSIGLILFAVFFCGETCSSPQYTGYAVSLIGMGMFDHAKQQLKDTAEKEAGQQKQPTR